MPKYLFWMLKYCESMRVILSNEIGVDEMSYVELYEHLIQPENYDKYRELASFLDIISGLSIEEKSEMLEKNYSKYFKDA